MSALDEFDAANPPEDFGGSDDLGTCQYPTCNNPIIRTGTRGRPPKYCPEHKGTKSSGSNSTVKGSPAGTENALRNMEVIYDGLGTALMTLGCAGSAGFLASKVEKTQAANRQAFDADPNLARMVNRFAEKSGKGIFIAANLSLLGPSLMIARAEISTRKRNAQAEAEQEAQTPPQRPSAPPQAPPQAAPAPTPQPAAPKAGNPLSDEVRNLRSVN